MTPCINDLLNIIADPLKLVLFADDTSIIITNPCPSKFKEHINNITDNINNWFSNNSLSLNFYKTYFLQFRLKNSHEINIQISCDNKLIEETKGTKFLRRRKNQWMTQVKMFIHFRLTQHVSGIIMPIVRGQTV